MFCKHICRLHSVAILACFFFGLAVATPTLPRLLPRAAPSIYFAQGESYAAGVGAGTRTSILCKRFSGAFGVQLNNLLGGTTKFTHQACSGAKCPEITEKQAITSDTDLVTLSAGGNDVGFAPGVIACIYKFKGRFSGDCDQKLQQSETTVDMLLPASLYNTIWSILNIAQKPSFRLYVTGYAKFFNAETSQCNSVTFSIWPNDPDMMTSALRQKMNDIVDKLNSKIASVINDFHQVGENRVKFIDIDPLYEGHRFCEADVVEPWESGEQRPNTWFFQLRSPSDTPNLSETDTPDDDTQEEWDGLEQIVHNGTLPNSNYRDLIIAATSNLPTIRLIRIFHPTSNGHAAAAEAIKADMDKFALPTNNPHCGEFLGTQGGCAENGCQGINDPETGGGVCTAGTYIGCPCSSECGPFEGLCTDDECAGKLNADKSEGICTQGKYAGCKCHSHCKAPFGLGGNGSCKDYGCEGYNSPGDQDGVCMAGEFVGCSCKSTCGRFNGKCTDNGCNGIAKRCTAGDYKGCPCGMGINS